MKNLQAIFFLLISASAMAQATVPQPVEERYPINYWWWILGVAIVLGLGIGAYMLIKKDPRKDAY